MDTGATGSKDFPFFIHITSCTVIDFAKPIRFLSLALNAQFATKMGRQAPTLRDTLQQH